MGLVKEEINLRKVILHVLDSTTGQPVLSETELEYGAEFSEFIRGHIGNIFGGDDSKRCEFHKRESERSIKNIVSRLKEIGKTVILIAHRLGTVMNSDEIFVLKEGKLVEQGTHTQLIEREGEYARFWKAQTEADHTDCSSAYFIQPGYRG